MGRPKGSPNKPKVELQRTPNGSAVLTVKSGTLHRATYVGGETTIILNSSLTCITIQ